MATIPSLVELLKAGVHFGHRKEKRHPKMAPYIFTQRHDIHIINAEETQKKIASALEFLTALSRENKKIVFVGTKELVKDLVKASAIKCGMPYVCERWLGGTITNFSVIVKLIKRLKELREKKAAGELTKYTKLEQLKFEREIEELERKIGGIEQLEKIPDALFIIDLVQEKTARREAERKKVPIVALCDTNANPGGVAFPIHGNDDGRQSVELILSLAVQVINEGKNIPLESPVIEVERENAPSLEEVTPDVAEER